MHVYAYAESEARPSFQSRAHLPFDILFERLLHRVVTLLPRVPLNIVCFDFHCRHFFCPPVHCGRQQRSDRARKTVTGQTVKEQTLQALIHLYIFFAFWSSLAHPHPSDTLFLFFAMARVSNTPASRPEVIQSLIDGVDRYNPDNVSILEEYLATQCTNKECDAMANLAILKL